LWTSPNHKAFASATAHYIDNDWVLHELVVGFSNLSGKHDGFNIANGFFDILTDFDLTSKVFNLICLIIII
jgi:hypothetical protein